MKTISRGLLLLLAALVPGGMARAEDMTIALVNAHILPMSATPDIERGTILIRGGKIAAVGTDVEIPDDARRIDAQGAMVTPGFMLADTSIGITELPMSPGLDDASAGGEFTAGFDISHAFNPASQAIAEVRREGSAYALITPTSLAMKPRPYGYFGGLGALVILNAGKEEVAKPRALATLVLGAQGASVAGGSRAIEIAQLKRLFGQLAAAVKDGSTPAISGLSAEDIAALIDVAAGRIPLLTTANRRSDILQAIDLALAYGLRMILSGADEGWMVADEIAAAKIPVLVAPTSDTPPGGTVWNTAMANAARLDAAGVTVAIGVNGGNRIFAIPTTRFLAGIAVANGLPHRRALEALTIVPTRLLGVDEQIGSIEVGKSADLAIWSGDPLEPSSYATTLLIHGIEQPLTTRQTLLRDRYLPAGLALPAPR